MARTEPAVGPHARLQPLEQASLVELAYQSIRDSIISGRFPMGSRLVEARIAQELGVSRGPVREALRRLREERLVLERPRQGSIVREFDGRDLVDIYNLRLSVESAAIRLAVRRKASTARLRQMIARMRAGADAENTERVVDAEYSFHEELCAASANDYLLDVYRTLSAQVRMALTLDNDAQPDLSKVGDEHEEIVEPMEQGGYQAAAESLIRRHIVGGVDDMIRRLGGDPDQLLHPIAGLGQGRSG